MSAMQNTLLHHCSIFFSFIFRLLQMHFIWPSTKFLNQSNNSSNCVTSSNWCKTKFENSKKKEKFDSRREKSDVSENLRKWNIAIVEWVMYVGEVVGNQLIIFYFIVWWQEIFDNWCFPPLVNLVWNKCTKIQKQYTPKFLHNIMDTISL